MSPLISLLIGLVIIGFALYVVKSLVPMDPIISNLISLIVVLVVLVWLLRVFGLWNGGPL